METNTFDVLGIPRGIVNANSAGPISQLLPDGWYTLRRRGKNFPGKYPLRASVRGLLDVGFQRTMLLQQALSLSELKQHLYARSFQMGLTKWV